MKLTVYHDSQFWVGVFEEEIDNELKSYKHIFGAEPQNEELLQFVHKDMLRLLRTCFQSVYTEKVQKKQANPKRLARQAAKEMKKSGISTQAQLALQQQFEEEKKARKILTRQQKEEMARKKYELKTKKLKKDIVANNCQNPVKMNWYKDSRHKKSTIFFCIIEFEGVDEYANWATSWWEESIPLKRLQTGSC